MPVDIVVMKAVNAENAARAAEVRAVLNQSGVLGLNLMSSPGSGKTTLLEAMFKHWGEDVRSCVVEGDVFTSIDAERIAKHGVEVIQVNTEGSCHMTAHMLKEILPHLALENTDVLFIENIGNLICPASFDLGEHRRIALISTPEGADKVEKYPKLFSVSHANVISKADLADVLEFDIAAVTKQLKKLNPEAPVFVTSAKTGEGVAEFCEWLLSENKETDN